MSPQQCLKEIDYIKFTLYALVYKVPDYPLLLGRIHA